MATTIQTSTILREGSNLIVEYLPFVQSIVYNITKTYDYRIKKNFPFIYTNENRNHKNSINKSI